MSEKDTKNDNKEQANQEQVKRNTKESFCPACAVVPVMMLGAGSAGLSSKGGYKKYKKIMLYGGLTVSIISLFIIIYYIFIKKCDKCLA